MVRKVAEKLGTNTAILLDLQGPKIRVAKLDEPIELIEGKLVQLRHDTQYVDNIIPVDYEGIARDVKSGDTIYLDDGKLELRVNNTDGNVITASVVRGGLLKSNKGLNLPGRQVFLRLLKKIFHILNLRLNGALIIWRFRLSEQAKTY